MLNYFPRWWPSWIGKKIIYWGNEIICCGNKIIYWGNKIICYGNKISFLWEQNNKLWEQDIILREQNKKNSHMALISQNFYLFCSLNIISCSYKKDILFPQQIILFPQDIILFPQESYFVPTRKIFCSLNILFRSHNISSLHCTVGVMVSVHASSAVNREFRILIGSNQTL